MSGKPPGYVFLMIVHVACMLTALVQAIGGNDKWFSRAAFGIGCYAAAQIIDAIHARKP